MADNEPALHDDKVAVIAFRSQWLELAGSPSGPAADPAVVQAIKEALGREPGPAPTMAEWRPFPETAPKDRPILVRGKWKPFDILTGGGTCIEIASWSTIMSDGSGYHWMLGLGAMDRWNVEFTEWTDLPE